MSTKKILKKFEQMYKDTYNSTLKYVVCRCSNLDDVDDIIQETYLELYNALKEKRDISNYPAYVIGIAKNKIIKYFNSHKKSSTISIFQEKDNEEFLIDLDSGIDIETDFITKENIDTIWNYIKEIDMDTARIFYLHFIKDMTLKEISEEIEIKESTIKSSLYRMIKNIKKMYLGGEKNEQ